jgi:ribonuclease HIII
LNNNYQILSQKDIQYGANFEVSYYDKIFILSIYYTLKNGFKFVFSKCDDTNIINEIKKILLSTVEVRDELEIPFKNYIGMDEAGKGDYFGPLILAGFIFDKSIERDLLEIGVLDSKLLSNDRIKQITRCLFLKYPERTKINEINPAEYNKKISDLKKIKGNLNTLLSLGYKDILEKCKNEHSDFGVVIDKFAKEDFILKILNNSISELKIILAERAERNIAVAAASVIARGIFLKGIEEISQKYNIKIPLGAGSEVTNFAKFFLNRFGEEALYSICKHHFKITRLIGDSLF